MERRTDSNKNSLAKNPDILEVLEKTILDNDLAKLSPRERTAYYLAVCKSLGLNPVTRPFELIRLNGRLSVYATKNCTDQLRQIHRVTLDNLESQVIGETFSVSLRATLPDGRQDVDMAAVSVKGLQGEALCNAMMKAITKAKRRLTLSICGLGGILDETEVATIPNVDYVQETRDIQDGQVWRSWKDPEDAIAWAIEMLPEYRPGKLREMFEQLEPRNGKKAEPWCEKILSLIEHEF